MDILGQQTEPASPIQVFFSYAHEDENLKIELEKHLSFLEQQGYIAGWNDRDIQAGQEWQEEIDSHLNAAQIILLLISSDFMASKYCSSIEMTKAMERHQAGEARVIPIILRPTDWQGAPFSKLQALPTNAKPITRWTDRDEAFLDVEQGIRKVVQKFRTQHDHLAFSKLPRLSELPDLKEDWGEAPDPGQFYGREKELNDLKQWIVDEHCRMVAVVGIGGIGKSSLVATLAKPLRESFEYVFGRSLQNTPSLQSILQDCIPFISDQRQIRLPEDVDEQLDLLIQYLRDYRCLIVLDNFESILQAGSHNSQYREGYKEYGKLLQHVGQSRHQSCLLLTSREKPKEVADLEGVVGPVRSMPLAGLSPVEGQEILNSKGLFGADNTVAELVHRYSGNPLALRLVAEPIQELFEGDIAGFLKEGQAVVSDINDLLDQQFHRLSEAEHGIMYWLAIEREPVSLDTLLEDIVDPSSKKELLVVLQSLRRRSMIETSRTANFTLQPVIMEYVTESLVKHVYQEIANETIGFIGSHALMKAQSKDYIRDSQVLLILMPVANRLIYVLGRKGLEEKCKKMLSHLRTAQLEHLGYIVGNVLNLLIQSQYDLHRYDFSHFTVRQAYLQGAMLSDVNFANATFANSTFTDTFGGILSIAFSPNKHLLAAGTANGEIRLWYANGAPALICKGHTDWVRSVAFSPDEKILVSGSEDQTVRLWEVETGKCLQTLKGHTSTVTSVVFSPDGSMCASGCQDKTIRLWNSNTGEHLRTMQGHNDLIWSIAFSPDGKTLASGSEDKTIRLWRVSSGKCLKILKGHSKSVYSVAFSPDGKTLASGSEDKTIRLWRVSSGKYLKILEGHTDWIWSVAFSPDGKTLVSGSDYEDGTIRLWDVESGACFKTMTGHTNTIWSVAFIFDGESIASGSSDQTIRLWEVSSGRCTKTLQGYRNTVHSVTFSPDGKKLACGSEDHVVRLWDIEKRQFKVLVAPGSDADRVWSVTFNKEGSMLASSSMMVYLWDMTNYQYLKTLPHPTWVYSVAFSADGRTLVSGDDNFAIRLWDVKSGQCSRNLPEQGDAVWSMALNSGKDILAGGTDDEYGINLWKFRSGQYLKTLSGHENSVRSLALAPAGKILASGSDELTVRLWNVDTGECLNILQEHTSPVYSVAFSPNGRTLASGSRDSTIKLWNVRTGKCLRTLREHDDVVWSVAFHPDGKTLASGSEDGTIKLWDTLTGECLQTFRSDRPYERMNITGIKGLTTARLATLRALGAIESDNEDLDE